jgi:hypothetical protein
LKTKHLLFAAVILFFSTFLIAQDIKRERPKEWEGLAHGGRFMDLFLPTPAMGELTTNTWGAKGVVPRSVLNGLEDNEWSYWGGNILLDDKGTYHLYVCRWPEDSEKGHMAWPQSEVVHATADNTLGPFKVQEIIGKGHNPEAYKLKDGRIFLYVNGGYYIANTYSGPWEYNTFEYDQRQRPIMDHLSNFTFAQREDGSYLMVCRGGGIWFSQTGLPPYSQVSEKSVYPPFEGKYEDPVVWRTNIQYHMIVNDWLGRIAYYLRSKDGINWKLDTGEAYQPGIYKYEDGTLVDWYKFERIKIFQDKYGRAIQANFAVIDTIKWDDKKNDNHSSKNVGIPLTVGRLTNILNQDKIDASTKFMDVKVEAEADFNPHKDMNIKSLRFGASEEVNYGRGSKVYKTKKSGSDLIITFKGEGNGITDENFAGKLMGKTKQGKLLFGYARLPWLDYNQQALSCKYPELSLDRKKLKIEVEVQNFGQVASKPSKIEITYLKDDTWTPIVQGEVPELKPFEKRTLSFMWGKFAERDETVKVKVTIHQENQKPSTLTGPIIIR